VTQADRKLSYASPPPAEREAEARLMFALLLPTGIFAAVFLGSWMFEDGDSRNVGGALCMFAMAPVAIVCSVIALIEATRPRGFRALLHGIAWSGLLVAGLCGSLWIIIQFRLLRHELWR
jgi:hypothetical protein